MAVPAGRPVLRRRLQRRRQGRGRRLQQHELGDGVPRPARRRRRRRPAADRPLRRLRCRAGSSSGTTASTSPTSTATARRTCSSSTAANWSIPYVGMLRSSGTGFSLVDRYDANMPGWQMRPGDQHFVGDFTGDGQGGSLGLQRRRLVDPVPRHAALERARRWRWRTATTRPCRAGRCARRPALRRRLRRRRQGRPLRLQRQRLVDRLPRHAAVDRLGADDDAPLRRQRAGLADAPQRPPLGRRHRTATARPTSSSTTRQDWAHGVPRHDDLQRHRPHRAAGRPTGSASGTSARSTSSSRATSRASAAAATCSSTTTTGSG